MLCRKRDPAAIAADVVEMRQAIAKEKGEDTRWDLKYAAAGWSIWSSSHNISSLFHAAEKPEILDTNTRACSTRHGASDCCRRKMPTCCGGGAAYHTLTQILRLSLSGPFDPKTAGAGLLGLLYSAADLQEFRHAECACG